MFYPADPDELRLIIRRFHAAVELPLFQGHILGIISPHAGYIYSGQVAAYGYRALEKELPETVIILAPSHRARFGGAALISEGSYETPLGIVEIDDVIGKRLASERFFTDIPEVFNMEHSLEVQIPFIQYSFPECRIVPVIIGTTDIDICSAIGNAVHEASASVKGHTAIVMSTDLSHYHGYDTAVSMDQRAIRAIERCDPEFLQNTLASGAAEACGEGPLAAGLSACSKSGNTEVHVLKYANSGDTAGDRSQVVGYVSAVVTGE